MKTHTHTPGPWRIDSKTRFGDYTIATGDSVKTCEFIAKTQNEANAQLIAAAPDLLAALRDLLLNATAKELHIRMLEKSETGEETDEDLDSPEMARARAVLSKAEGQA